MESISKFQHLLRCDLLFLVKPWAKELRDAWCKSLYSLKVKLSSLYSRNYFILVEGYSLPNFKKVEIIFFLSNTSWFLRMYSDN